MILFNCLFLIFFLFQGCSACSSHSNNTPANNSTDNTNDTGTGDASVGENIGACGNNIGTSVVDGTDFNYVLGTTVFEPANMSFAQKCSPFKDGHFNSTLMRVSATGEYSGHGIENEYARSDPENSNGTRLILRSNDGNWNLYDAANFNMLFQLTGLIQKGGEELEPRWDTSDPNIFYYLDGPMLRSYNVVTRQSTTVHDFTQEFPTATYITTKTEGDASLDRRYWCFMIESENYHVNSVVTYDKTSNSILGQKNSFKDGINWVSMDMSGSHCVIGYEDSDNDGDEITPPAEAFSKTFSSSVSLPTGGNGHLDLALNKDGHDVMVYQNNATDYIEVADLTTGVVTQLVSIPFDVNGDIGLHVSGNSSATPGWALISTYGAKQVPSGQKHSWMDNQVFMLELKASPKIWRVAHNHAYTSDHYNPENPVNYFAESFAAINTKGTKIFFGSNWSQFTDIEYTDAYQISLPSGWATALVP